MHPKLAGLALALASCTALAQSVPAGYPTDYAQTIAAANRKRPEKGDRFPFAFGLRLGAGQADGRVDKRFQLRADERHFERGGVL